MLESVRQIYGHVNKQLTNHSSETARNCQRIEMVSIQRFSCSTHQKLGNSRWQTGNFVEWQSCVTKVAQLYCVSDMGLMLPYAVSSQNRSKHCKSALILPTNSTDRIPPHDGREYRTCDTIEEWCATMWSLSAAYSDALTGTFSGHTVTEYAVHENPPFDLSEQYTKQFKRVGSKKHQLRAMQCPKWVFTRATLC